MTGAWAAGRFADLADGGRALAEVVAGRWDGDDVVVAGVVPNGVPAALAVARALGVPLLPIEVVRSGAGPDDIGRAEPAPDDIGRAEPVVTAPAGVAGRTVIVVDDAVETGTAARIVASALRAAGAARLVLAVPVCPREAEAAMLRGYDEVVAVARPLARRSLNWHYERFEPVDPDAARAWIREYAAAYRP